MTSPPQTQNDGQEVRKEKRGIAPDSGNKTSFSGTRTAQCSNVNKWRYLRAEEKFQLNVARRRTSTRGARPTRAFCRKRPSEPTAKINSSARGRRLVARAPRARYKGLCALVASLAVRITVDRGEWRDRYMDSGHAIAKSDRESQSGRQGGGAIAITFSAILPWHEGNSMALLTGNPSTTGTNPITCVLLNPSRQADFPRCSMNQYSVT